MNENTNDNMSECTKRAYEYVSELYQGPMMSEDVITPLLMDGPEAHINDIVVFIVSEFMQGILEKNNIVIVNGAYIGVRAAFMLGYSTALSVQEQNNALLDVFKSI